MSRSRIVCHGCRVADTVNGQQFSFITVFLSLLLHLLEPISRQLQGEAIDVHAAVELINAVRAEVQGMRSDEKFQSIIEESNVNIQEQEIQEDSNSSVQPKRRKRMPNSKLNDYVVLAGYRYEEGHSSTATAAAQPQKDDPVTPLRVVYFNVLDTCLAELDRRFNERSTEILAAIRNLCSADRKIELLKALMELISSCVDSKELCLSNNDMLAGLRAELPLANRMLAAQSLEDLFKNLQTHANSLCILNLLCTAALCLPCSTARVLVWKHAFLH